MLMTLLLVFGGQRNKPKMFEQRRENF